MTKNPIFNALGASGYIILVVSVINFISLTQGSKPDTPFAPVVFLSLLTLSVVTMAYMFFYQPLLLIVDGKKKEGVDLFAKTVGFFTLFTVLILVLLFSGVI